MKRVIVKSKDKTTEIKNIRKENNYYYITYQNSDKEYKYLLSDVQYKKEVFDFENELYEYYREIADNQIIKSIGGGETEELKILKSYFDNFKEIPSDSILSKLINHLPVQKDNLVLPVLFPFGFNPHQKEACENALTNDISIIDGPPGTGKTQTVLNIIANLIVQNKTIAVISNNNTATQNIFEKLEKVGLSPLIATLGKKDHIENFANHCSRDNFPDHWNLLSPFNHQRYLLQKYEELQYYLEQKNELAKLETELEQITLEHQYFKNHKKITKDIFENIFYDRVPSSHSIQLMSFLEFYEKYSMRIFPIVRFILQRKYRFIDPAFFLQDVDLILDQLQKCIYEQLEFEKKKKIQEISNYLNKHNYLDVLACYTDHSMMIWKDYIAKHFQKQSLRSYQDIFKTKNLCQDYPIILSTTYSLINCIEDQFLFDYIIVDESSQVDLATAFLALSCGKKIVIVGDLQQLPTVVDRKMKEIHNEIISFYDIPHEWRYTESNLLYLVQHLYPDCPKTLLCEHYRCHPDIIGFCNQQFYNNELIILSKRSSEDPFYIKETVEGNHARMDEESKSWINYRQGNMIHDEIFPELGLSFEDDSIGIITPYRKQCETLSQLFPKNIQIETVHKFQGKEMDVIIFSTVANQVDSFIADPKLINVAVSRAKNKFVLATHYGCEKGNNLIASLIRYIRYHSGTISFSKICSIYDILYSQKKTESFLSKFPLLSKLVISEHITTIILNEILQYSNYSSLNFYNNYRLNDLIIDFSSFSEREIRFIRRSHVDFIIFRKDDDKMPILAIEVDGGRHFKKKQKIRDQLKNEILNKANIPLLRLPTNGNGEKEKIMNALNQVLNS